MGRPAREEDEGQEGRGQKVYDPIRAGSIDGTDTSPHDRAIVRALESRYKPSAQAVGDPEATLIVARLGPNITQDTVAAHFSDYGRIKRIRLVRDLVTGISRGYAFLEFSTRREALDAFRDGNQRLVEGRQVLVDFECQRTLKGWKPRRLGGGFGGRRESGQLRFGGRDRPFKTPIVSRTLGGQVGNQGLPHS